MIIGLCGVHGYSFPLIGRVILQQISYVDLSVCPRDFVAL